MVTLKPSAQTAYMSKLLALKADMRDSAVCGCIGRNSLPSLSNRSLESGCARGLIEEDTHGEHWFSMERCFIGSRAPTVGEIELGGFVLENGALRSDEWE